MGKRSLFTPYIGFVVLLGFVTSACTTTQDANEGLQLRYVGKSADDFFIKHGPPKTKYPLDNGKLIYIWSERPTIQHVPASSNTTVNLDGDTAYASTTTTPASEIIIQCEVKIIASETGMIEQIEAHGDTVGNWETSRCAEIFRIRSES